VSSLVSVNVQKVLNESDGFDVLREEVASPYKKGIKTEKMGQNVKKSIKKREKWHKSKNVKYGLLKCHIMSKKWGQIENRWKK
jgi:hypothetical protein